MWLGSGIIGGCVNKIQVFKQTFQLPHPWWHWFGLSYYKYNDEYSDYVWHYWYCDFCKIKFSKKGDPRTIEAWEYKTKELDE